MAVKRVRSPYPVYAVGVVWLLWGLLLPMYTFLHFGLLIALSVAVYALSRKFLWKDAVLTLPDPEPEPVTEEDKALAALRKERDMALSELRRLNAAIPDPTLTAQIDHLEDVAGKIFSAVEEHPEKRPQIRRFLEYYLPTTLKLLNAYDRMDSAGISGANIDGAKGKIGHMMNVVTAAFDKQLDSLYGAEAMDITADIAVMEQLLAQEGLGESSPFSVS